MEWRPAMTTWRGEEPKGQRGERMWESREQRGRGGASTPLIVGQISGAGHTWLLPGRCGVEAGHDHVEGGRAPGAER